MVAGPLNRILYGPPGTGKTYRSVAEAVAIIEGKAVGELMAQAAYPETKRRFETGRRSYPLPWRWCWPRRRR